MSPLLIGMVKRENIMMADSPIIDKIAYQKRLIALILFIAVISILMGGWHIDLPGFQMDEANHAAFVPGILDVNAAQLPHYRLPDNYIDLKDGVSRYPILGGSFYNSVVTAYLGLPVYEIFGFSLDSIRFFHGVIGFLCVLLGSLFVARFAGFLPAYFFAAIVATNPDFVFSLRSQGAIFWPVVLFAMAAVYFLLWTQSILNPRRKIWFVFFSGLFLGLSVMSYFVGVFIALPFLVYAWFSLNNTKKYYLVLLLGMFIGYLPVIYSVISVYLYNPDILDTFGMPNFAIKNNLATFSFDNFQRIILLFEGGLGNFSFTRGVVGHFRNPDLNFRFFIFVAIAVLGLWGILRRKYLFNQTVLLSITSGILTIYLIGAFFLKALSFHHLLPLFFVLAIQAAVLISGRGYIKYLLIPFGAVLLGGNVNALILAHNSLDKTGGLSFHNEMYTQVAEILHSECADCFPVFISWGLHLQFLFLTEGQEKYAFLPGITAEKINKLIFQHGKIVLIGTANDLDDIEFSKNEIDEFHSVELRQRDGVRLYEMRMLQISDDRLEFFSSLTLEVANWGPRSTFSGVVPNPQSGGFAGMWIQTNVDPDFGVVQLIFDGKPAKLTQFNGELITAAIDAENFKMPGEKRISIRQVLTGREFPVGTFVVTEH